MNHVKLFLIGILLIACQSNKQPKNVAERVEEQPHIVFVIGDEEYRSEESMPMLAQIAKRELNAKISLCYAVDSLGYIDPNRKDHIAGLEALEDADLMVMFTRFRALPKQELEYITTYAESGKPMMGFRTSTHAFRYENDSTLFDMNNQWPTKIFGQQWITHHGHFDDGHNPLTKVELLGNSSPILNQVKPFKAYSWLYHVDGGEWSLYGDSSPLLKGTSLKSNHEMKGRLDQFALTNPVAWTKTYTGKSGLTSKVFFTTLGHPYDWQEESMRYLAINAIYWLLDKPVPDKANVDFVTPYQPNNSGFGKKYKPNQKPMVIN